MCVRYVFNSSAVCLSAVNEWKENKYAQNKKMANKDKSKCHLLYEMHKEVGSSLVVWAFWRMPTEQLCEKLLSNTPESFLVTTERREQHIHALFLQQNPALYL